MEASFYFFRDVLELFPDLKPTTLRSWIKYRKLRPKRISNWNFAFSESDVSAIRSLLEQKGS